MKNTSSINCNSYPIANTTKSPGAAEYRYQVYGHDSRSLRLRDCERVDAQIYQTREDVGLLVVLDWVLTDGSRTLGTNKEKDGHAILIDGTECLRHKLVWCSFLEISDKCRLS